jgi:dephospho-CoA kinase
MLKVGITGGIGVGKSVVCKIFAALHTPIYDADSRAKWLMVNDKNLVATIKNTFGEQAYTLDNQINRDFMISQILGSPQTAQQLESLVHPAVRIDFEDWLTKTANQNPTQKYVLKEAALLVESGSYKELDKLIVVSAAMEVRMTRVLARDLHRNRQQIAAIMAKQIPETEKIAKADFVIYNNGTELLIPQVLAIHHILSNIA